MGLFDKITKSIGAVEQRIAEENQKQKELAAQRAIQREDRARLKKDLLYLKECVLERLDIRQLKNCCRYYEIGEPDSTKYNWSTGNRNKIRLTKADWIEHIQDGVTLEDIKDYAKKQRINISDIIKEEEELALKRAAAMRGESIEPDLILYPENQILQSIIASINEFQPARAYKEESHYQIELNGWLKSRFPSAGIEIQTGYSRPDIVIDNVAIEIKGPTRARDLNTIMDKCHRYLQNHDHLIVVLFGVDVPADRYAEWLDGIQTHYPDVPVIRKD